MARRRNKSNRAQQRKKDLVYGSQKVRHLTNMLMLDGKYTKAYRHVCQALRGAVAQVYGGQEVPAGTETAPHVTQVIQLIDELIEKVGPHTEVKSKRIGGATYPVPTPVRPERRVFMAFFLLIKHARARKGVDIAEALKREIVDAMRGTGGAMTECTNILSAAKANIAFAR